MTREDLTVASYKEVAARLRADIAAGRLPLKGRRIPGLDKLAKHYGVARDTAHKAVRHLVNAGLLYSEGRRGTFVRETPPAPTVLRDRAVYRDGIGYFFDRAAQDWRAFGTPTQRVDVPPGDVAALLGVPEDGHVMIRDRAVGPPDAEHPLQIVTSYLPMPLVGELPILGAARTGKGGIYDRIEEHRRTPIRWQETISARPATDEEQDRLRIGAGLPVLVLTRVARAGDEVVEVAQTRMAADRFAVQYPELPRDTSAAWPREEPQAAP
ncbi:GntR family transcriptional regulator [Streptomyces sp. NPDC059506]|uniref:GntR family transcriptional regulator n=1 Tax=Streptomyces sp. NPDC059506 TaxID=3347751 RepID=UPI0036B24D8D